MNAHDRPEGRPAESLCDGDHDGVLLMDDTPQGVHRGDPRHVSVPLEELLLDLMEPTLARMAEAIDAKCRRVGLRRMVSVVSQLHGHRRLDAIGEDVIRAGLELVRFQHDLDVLVAGDVEDVRDLAGEGSL